MKEEQITINERTVLDRIKNESAHTAQIRSTAGQPYKLASLTIAGDEDKKIIDGYIELAAGECAITISHYLAPCTVTKENEAGNNGYKIHRFKVMLPENYPAENITLLGNIITDYICNRSLQQWYMLTKSDDANTAALKTQSSMSLLRDTLNMRKKP